MSGDHALGKPLRRMAGFDWRRIFGGAVLPLTLNNRFVPRQFAWMVAGGPLAGFAVTLLCSFMLLTPSSYRGWWVDVLSWSILLNTISLIPGSAGVNKTDGARLVELLRYPSRVQTWIALIAMQSEERTGVRPRDWSEELVECVRATEPAATHYSYAQLLLAYRAIDQGNEEAACLHLESALAASAQRGKAFRQGLFLEAAAAVAQVSKNSAHARIWFQRAKDLRKVLTPDHVEGTIAFCEERYDDALKHLTAARERFKRKRLDSGLARLAIEKLEERISLCRIALQPAHSD